MKTLRDALADYISAQRALGLQLRCPASGLRRFVDFMAHEGASFITTELAIQWATEPAHVQQATRSGRLSMVRRFATWASAGSGLKYEF